MKLPILKDIRPENWNTKTDEQKSNLTIVFIINTVGLIMILGITTILYFLDVAIEIVPIVVSLVLNLFSNYLLYKGKQQIVITANTIGSLFSFIQLQYLSVFPVNEVILIPLGLSTMIGWDDKKLSNIFFNFYLITVILITVFIIDEGVSVERSIIDKSMYLITFLVMMFLTKEYINRKDKLKKQNKDLTLKTHLQEKKHLKKDIEGLSLSKEVLKSQKQKLLQTIESLKNSQNRDQDINTLILSIKSEIEGSKIQTELERDIDTVNTGYYEKLREQFPKLTRTDIQICSLLRIGKTPKEIAEIRNVSVKGLYVTTARIKVKMELKKGSNLSHFLRTL